MHPFLTKDFHIRWSTLTPEHIETDITKALNDAKSSVDAVAALAQSNEALSYQNTIVALDDGLEALNRAWGLISHLDSVCNSSELRDAHNKMLPKVSEFYSSIPLNQNLWNTLKAFGESDAARTLSTTKQRYLKETLMDFREQGADLIDQLLENLLRGRLVADIGQLVLNQRMVRNRQCWKSLHISALAFSRYPDRPAG